MVKILLFTNQLFNPEILLKIGTDSVYLIEHPVFYGFRKNNTMNFNKKKIILHKASCLAYIDELKKNKINVNYVEFNDKYSKKEYFEGIEDITYYDTVDKEIEEDINNYCKNAKKLETPNFLNTKKELQKYIKEQRRRPFFHFNFYNYQLKKLKIPYIDKSYDTENRNALPDEIKVPDIWKPTTNKYIKKAVAYVENKFPNNYGTSTKFYLPITRKDANKWLDDFIDNRFNKFGTYQDSIHPSEPFQFHSLLSPLLNIGLLDVNHIVNKAIKSFEKNKVKIESYEAFLRQVIGWREYQRMIYIVLGDKIRDMNYFNNKRRLKDNWYNGTTGIQPVDDAINMGFRYGYLHHISRLMVMSNIMNLCQITPHEVYKWFMEFSVDSYDWVMIGNVYSMGMWADGGLTMRKPYISSGNYIKNMSGNRYNNKGFLKLLRALFYNFLAKNSDKLNKTPYARNLGVWNKFNKEKKDDILKLANDTIKKLTK